MLLSTAVLFYNSFFHYIYIYIVMCWMNMFNCRVVQKNLVFVVGLSQRLAEPDVLKKHEYFGKFGKIHKVVINQSTSYAGSQVHVCVLQKNFFCFLLNNFNSHLVVFIISFFTCYYLPFSVYIIFCILRLFK